MANLSVSQLCGLYFDAVESVKTADGFVARQAVGAMAFSGLARLWNKHRVLASINAEKRPTERQRVYANQVAGEIQKLEGFCCWALSPLPQQEAEELVSFASQLFAGEITSVRSSSGDEAARVQASLAALGLAEAPTQANSSGINELLEEIRNSSEFQAATAEAIEADKAAASVLKPQMQLLFQQARGYATEHLLVNGLFKIEDKLANAPARLRTRVIQQLVKAERAHSPIFKERCMREAAELAASLKLLEESTKSLSKWAKSQLEYEEKVCSYTDGHGEDAHQWVVLD